MAQGRIRPSTSPRSPCPDSRYWMVALGDGGLSNKRCARSADNLQRSEQPKCASVFVHAVFPIRSAQRARSFRVETSSWSAASALTPSMLARLTKFKVSLFRRIPWRRVQASELPGPHHRQALLRKEGRCKGGFQQGIAQRLARRDRFGGDPRRTHASCPFINPRASVGASRLPVGRDLSWPRLPASVLANGVRIRVSPIQLELSWCCPSCLRSRGRAGRHSSRGAPKLVLAHSPCLGPGSLGQVSGVFDLVERRAGFIVLSGLYAPAHLRSSGPQTRVGRRGSSVGNAVAVSVGSDHAGSLAPGRGSPPVGGRCSKSVRPRRALRERGFEKRRRVPRSVLLARRGCSHFGAGPVRLWDEGWR